MSPISTALLRSHYALGEAWFEIGQTAESKKHFVETIRLRPDFTEAYNALGVAMLKSGETIEAANLFRTAMKMNPADFKIRINLMLALLRLGQCQKAREQLAFIAKLPSIPEQVHQSLERLFEKACGGDSDHRSNDRNAKPDLSKERPPYP